MNKFEHNCDSNVHDHSHSSAHSGHASHMKNMAKKLKISVIFSIPLFLITPIMGFGQLMHFPLDWLGSLLLGSVIYFYGGTPFFIGSISELRSRKPAMMTLISLGITTAYIYSVYATFSHIFGGNAMNFWFEISTLIIIMLAGHLIEMRSISRAGDATKGILSLMPKTAHLTDGKEVQIMDLKPGDEVLVKENERVPADGIALEKTYVDESQISGESNLIAKNPNDLVFGGSLNQNFPFKMKITATGKLSYLARVADLVRRVQMQKSRVENFADRVAGWLFCAALISALMSFVVWLFIGGFSAGVAAAVSVLVIACPHALGLAVPLVVAKLTNISARNGLLIQNRTSLESVKKIRYALMDKTGTLTDGKFSVREVVEFAKSSDILEIAAALESGSTHPIARAITDNSLRKMVAKNIKNLPGFGIEGEISGEIFRVVSQDYLAKNNICYDKNLVKSTLKKSLTIAFVLWGEEAIGFISLGDEIKNDSKEFIRELKKRKITPIMLTGDNQSTAKKVADALEISDFQANLKPENKSQIVEKYHKKGGVMFVGDGVNDSPALAASDLGIAIGAGTSVAIAAADIVLINSNLSDIIKLLDISKISNRKMKQNLAWGAGYNIVAIPMAAAGLITPIFAAVLMSFSTVIVAINAATMRYKNK